MDDPLNLDHVDLLGRVTYWGTDEHWPFDVLIDCRPPTAAEVAVLCRVTQSEMGLRLACMEAHEAVFGNGQGS